MLEKDRYTLCNHRIRLPVEAQVDVEGSPLSKCKQPEAQLYHQLDCFWYDRSSAVMHSNIVTANYRRTVMLLLCSAVPLYHH